jgi:DNA-binding transcriptional LysR family regulator
MDSSDMGFTRELALAGGGIAVLPSATIANDVERGALVRLLDGALTLPKGALFLVHKKTRVLSAKVRAFRDVVVEALGERKGPLAAGAPPKALSPLRARS